MHSVAARRSISTSPDDTLERFIGRYPNLLVLTGAGCSTDSGIPDYRDLEGEWKRPPPMTYATFMNDPVARARYWARSMIGWRHFSTARPNRTHAALSRLEQLGHIHMLVTQNVDGLHQAAGSQQVVDLHGRLDRVRCMACEKRIPRVSFQQRMTEANPQWTDLDAPHAPDGDADLDDRPFAEFVIPCCAECGGVLKPDVVFFGEQVPRGRLNQAMSALDRSDALLVLGSSLMVYSGYRFAACAAKQGKPIAAINLGHNRAEPLLELKLDCRCDEALAFVNTIKRKASGHT